MGAKFRSLSKKQLYDRHNQTTDLLYGRSDVDKSDEGVHYIRIPIVLF